MCVCVCNFFENKSTICFFWFSFISFLARQVSAALLPAPQLCWIKTGDGGGGIRPSSMKPTLKDTQAPVAFLEWVWQLQSQRISRSKVGGVCVCPCSGGIGNSPAFSRTIPSSVGASPCTCKKQNFWSGENSFISSWSWPVVSLFSGLFDFSLPP